MTIFVNYLLINHYYILFILPFLLLNIYIFNNYKYSNTFMNIFINLIIFILFIYIFILYYTFDILGQQDNSWLDSSTIYMYHLLDKFQGKNSYLFADNVFNGLIIMFLIGGTICVLISSKNYWNYEKQYNVDFPLLILLCLQGSILVVTAKDLLGLYLGLEIQSLSLYVMATLRKYSHASVESGLKYFLFGSFFSGLLLFGLSLIYGFTGSLSFLNIYLILETSTSYWNLTFGFFAGILLFTIGLFFKLGIVPFHFWISEVYEGSPLIVVYFFSVVPKLPIYVLLLNLFYYILYYYFAFFSSIFLYLALLSIALGSFLAFYETDIKKFLAYSTISQLGYVLLSFSLGTLWSVWSSVYYFLIYILILINIFSILMLLKKKSKTFYEYKKIIDLVHLKDSNLILALLLAFSFLALASIPPFSGFFGKLLILINLISSYSYLLIIYLLLFSVFSAIYYIRLLRFLWFMDMGDYRPQNLKIDININIYLILGISFVNIFFMFFQIPLMEILLS